MKELEKENQRRKEIRKIVKNRQPEDIEFVKDYLEGSEYGDNLRSILEDIDLD